MEKVGNKDSGYFDLEYLNEVRERLDNIQFKPIKKGGDVTMWFFCEHCGEVTNLTINGKLQTNCKWCNKPNDIAERLIKYYEKSS